MPGVCPGAKERFYPETTYAPLLSVTDRPAVPVVPLGVGVPYLGSGT